MARVEAHRACERFGRVECDAVATLVSDLSFGSLEQSRRDTASLPIWEHGHPSQMTFFTSSRTGNSAHHISFRHRDKYTHLAQSILHQFWVQNRIRKRCRRVAVIVG